MRVYISVYNRIMSVCVCVSVYVCMRVYMSVCMSVSIYVCECMCERVYVSVCQCMCECMCVCACAHHHCEDQKAVGRESILFFYPMSFWEHGLSSLAAGILTQ